MIDMHYPVLNCLMSEDCCKIVVQLENSKDVPLLCLHNCPEPANLSASRLHYTNINEGDSRFNVAYKTHRVELSIRRVNVRNL